MTLDDMDGATLQGAWRALCAGMLASAVDAMRKETSLLANTRHRKHWFKKDDVVCRGDAVKWLDGKRGLITYEDCCEALDVDPESLRSKIESYCHSQRRKPICPQWKRRT